MNESVYEIELLPNGDETMRYVKKIILYNPKEEGSGETVDGKEYKRFTCSKYEVVV